jgi:hypothetical protein
MRQLRWENERVQNVQPLRSVQIVQNVREDSSVGSDVAMAPNVSSTILDSTTHKGFPSFQLLLRSRTSAYLRIGMRRVIGFETIGTSGTIEPLEHLELLEPLELLKSVRLHGGN